MLHFFFSNNFLIFITPKGVIDLPESITAALRETLGLNLCEKSTKICVVIADGIVNSRKPQISYIKT
jgi:hypothetical protein